MKRSLVYMLLAFALLSLIVACEPNQTPPLHIDPTAAIEPTATPTFAPTPTPGNDSTAPLVAQAKADLAQRLGIDVEQIEVQSVQPTEFRDASLGVPEPGKAYAQVITLGYIIELTTEEGESYRYHAAKTRVVAAPDPAEKAPPIGAQITIEGVEVTADHVAIRGTSTLPDETCINTELWASGVAQPWWPTETCAPVQQGAWMLDIPLAADQALQPGVQYMVRAYQPGGPNIVATFPFDLDAPPTPTNSNPGDDTSQLLP